MYEELKHVLDGLKSTHYSEGEVIFRINDPAEEFYYLKSGLALTVATTHDGQERAVMTTWPGRTFGTASFCCRCERRSTAIAAKPCEVVTVNWSTYRTLLARYPDLAQFLSYELAVDTQALFDQLLEGSVLDADVRVARYISRRIDRQQCSHQNGTITIEYTQDFIGKTLGISRWSVNQALARFRKNGWLTTNYGIISVIAPDELRKFAFDI